MVLSGPDDIADEAIVFWRKHLGSNWTPDFTDWLRARVHEVQLMWRDVGFLNRTRRMWRQLSAEIERRDPTNPWARNYDRLYLEAQVLRLARVVLSSNRRPRSVSLARLLLELLGRPQFLVALHDDGFPHVPAELQTDADARHDLHEMRQRLRTIMAWRDKAIAHTEQTPDLPPLAWAELDETIVVVSEVFHRYARRLTGFDYQVEFDGGLWDKWQAVFRHPLFVTDADGENDS